jgi:hypothetical protein
MAVAADALETYDSKTIREDLSDAENMISPTETPFYSMITGRSGADNTKVEWPVVELASQDLTNRVPEGEDAPAIDAPTVALRMANFTQISDKVVKVSDTSQRVNGAANVEKLSKQIAYKLKELKRDCEGLLLAPVAADPGAAVGATTRVSAGFPSFLITNTDRDATSGADPTYSNTTDGYPDAPATDSSATRNLTETMLNDNIQSIWSEGGEPRYTLCSPVNKRVISENFTGFATKYKDGDDKKLINAVDVYESDFGTVQIVPDRFMGTRVRDVYNIDPDYVKVRDLQPTRQMPLARTGHTENRLIQKEYSLEVSNEKAHGVIADTNG